MPWRPVNNECTEEGQVYVLHFSRPIGTVRQQAGHYAGFASYKRGGAAARVEEHREGRGARLTQVAVDNGVELQLAQVYDHCTRADERRLKNRGGLRRVCRICRGESS